MAEEDDIVQNIKVVVDEEETTSAFDKLKEAAQSAMEAIKKVFEEGDLGGAFEKMKEAGVQAFEALKEAGTQSAESVKKTFSEVDLGSAFERVKEIGTSAFEDLKNAGSKSFEELKRIFQDGNLSTAFSKIKEIGINAFDALKQRGTDVFTALGQAMELLSRFALGIAAAFAAVALAVALAGKEFFNFVESQSKIVEALRVLSEKTHTTIKDISEMETAFAHAGVTSGEFASGFLKLSEVVNRSWEQIKKDVKDGADTIEEKSIAAERALLSLAAAQRKAADKDNRSLNSQLVDEQIAKTLELREAELKQRETEKALNDSRRNDLNQIARSVQELMAGNQEALRNFNATADNIIKGVVAAAGQGSSALEGLGKNFAAVGSRAPAVKDVLENLGRALQNIPDPALRSEVALKALGKSGEDFISAFKSGDLDGFLKRVREIGPAVDEVDKKIASDFSSALTGLGQDLENIKIKISSAFGPGFTDILKTLDEMFTRNQANIVRFAETIANILLPPLKLAATVIQAIAEALSALVDIIRNVVDLFTSFMKLDFSGMLGSLKNLYEILKAIAEILSGDVKKGLDDLAKQRNAEKKVEDDKEAEKRKSADDDIKQKSVNSDDGAMRTLSGRKIDPDMAAEIESMARFNEAQARAKRGLPPIQPPEPPTPEPSLMDRATKAVDDVEGKAAEIGKQAVQSMSSAFESITKSIGDAINKLVSPDKPAPTTDNKSGLDDQASNALQNTATSAQSASTALDGIATTGEQVASVGEAANNASTSLATIPDATQGVTGALQELTTAMQTAATALRGDSTGGSGNVVEAAGGGWIQGEGTETSDSIRAWLSHNEFVQPAAATRHYGVEFMESVRNLRFPRFNVGGLVGLLSPQMPRTHFATGGLVSAPSSNEMHHLGTVDLQTDHGPIRVAVDRVGFSQLKTAAVKRNIGKGKQPGWVK